MRFQRLFALSLLLGAPMVAVADEHYGINPADPSSIQRGIEAAAKAGASKVVIPPGTYRLPRPENSPWHLRFTNLRNLEIDGTGVNLIFLGRDKRAILFDYCEGVTLRGITLNREVPPFSQGKVAAITEDRKAVDVRIDRGYPTDVDDTRYFPRIPVLTIYRPGSRELKPLVPDLYITSLQRLDTDLIRFHLRDHLKESIVVELQDPVAWRGPSGADLAFWSSAGIKVENVTIKNGTGLGVHELCGEGGNIYRNVTITYAERPAGAEADPLLACATDGFHSGSVRRGPTLENCRFEGLNDDAVNIHGSWAMLMEVSGEKIVIDYRPTHTGAREYIPFARTGDRIRLYDTKGALASEGRILSPPQRRPDYRPVDTGWRRSRFFTDSAKADYWEITLDRAMQSEPGGLVSNPDAVGEGFKILNCSFRNNRGHGLFIRAGNGIIENCTVEGTAMGGIVVAPEMFAWNEADYARKLTIKGNSLRNVGVASQPWNSGITVASFEYGSFTPLPGGHRDITIQDNTFEEVRGPNLVVTSSIGVSVTNNRFIRPMNEPAWQNGLPGITNYGALFWCRSSADVCLEGNVVSSPGKFFQTLVDADDSVTMSGTENGIVLKK